MCAKGWVSAHVCVDSVVHACAVSVQCTCVHGRCNVSMHWVSAVHVCAWLVHCMYAQVQCSACMGTASAAFMVRWVPVCTQPCSTCVHRVSSVCSCARAVQHGQLSSVPRCAAQPKLGWTEAADRLPPPQLTQHLLARSEVQRAVPAWEVQEGGVLLPLRRGLRRT